MRLGDVVVAARDHMQARTGNTPGEMSADGDACGRTCPTRIEIVSID
jgi:hypothetical protein